MAKPSSEKQTYSVDEMMERLRDEERNKTAKEEGELVTREDGTQVLRVKKRKRRSSQKKEEKAKRAKTLVVIKTVLCIAVPLFLGLAILLTLAKYNSGTFRSNLDATLSERVGGSAKVSRFSPLLNTVSASNTVVAWPDGSLLDLLKVSNLKGDLNVASLFAGGLRGEKITAATGALTFSRREGRQVSSRKKGEVLELPGFQVYKSESFSFYFGRSNSPFRLQEAEVSLESRDSSQFLRILGGSLVASSWGELPLNRASVEFFDGRAKMSSFDIESETLKVVLSGTLDPDQAAQTLAIKVDEGGVGELAGEDLGLFFQADLRGSAGTLKFESWDFSSHEVLLKSPAKYLNIKNFAFLESLSEFYGESRYRKLEFESKRELEIARGAGWVEVRDLFVSEVGVLGLKGNVRLEGDVLSGKLFVGLPVHKRLILRPEQKANLVSEAEIDDGFAWLPVSLSGRSDDPQDDFLDHLQSGKSVLNESDLFDELTR